jgi:hypothetical protein
MVIGSSHKNGPSNMLVLRRNAQLAKVLSLARGRKCAVIVAKLDRLPATLPRPAGLVEFGKCLANCRPFPSD